MAVRVTDDISYGNVCDVEIIRTTGQLEVKFAASTHGGPECLWFCFRIEWDEIPVPSEQLRLTLKHARSMLGVPPQRPMNPVVRTDGGDWTRLKPAMPTSRSDGGLSISWETPLRAGTLDVALCYPYGRSELQALLDETGGYWTDTVIGVTQGDRPIIRLCNEHALSGQEYPALLFTARQHSGETPGSWVLDGVLRTIANRDPGLAVWAVPLANLDGVEQGDYGKDNFPYDVNRAWGHPAMRHETLVMQRDIQWLTEWCRPALGIDFHAPGGTEAVGAYTFVPSQDQSVEAHDAVTQLAKVFGTALGEYAADEFARVITYSSRWETPTFTIFCAEQLGIGALTLETPYGLVGQKVLERADYREIGRRIVGAIIDREDEL